MNTNPNLTRHCRTHDVLFPALIEETVLVGLEGLEALGAIGEDMHVTGNPSLESVDGFEALHVIVNGPEGSVCVIADLMMSDPRADELAIEIRRIPQNIPIILTSG